MVRKRFEDHNYAGYPGEPQIKAVLHTSVLISALFELQSVFHCN